MRCISISLIMTIGVLGFVPRATAAPAEVRGACGAAEGRTPIGETASRANAVTLLSSVTQLLSPFGKPVMTSNFATTVAINNEATPALRAQALIDSQITAANAYTFADGLGATMARIYRAKATFSSDDDGANIQVGHIGPRVAALIAAGNATSAGDSGEGKCAYADGVEPFEANTFRLPPAGTYDVIGIAYGHPAGSAGADPYGNSRPFQTAPIGAASGPAIKTFDSKDFFGVAANSRIVLTGPTDAEKSAGRTGADLVDSPSFPSGHTTFSYTEALILAMMVPERYAALAYRGSEYGHSRIVVGAHYAIDIIGGRTLATYDLAQDLADRPGYARGGAFQAALAAATTELRAYLKENGCPSIAACAARDPIVRAANANSLTKQGFQPSTPRQAYAFRLNYGLAPMGPENLPPVSVPVEAGYLLQSRFPYLTLEQRREVLRTTEGPSGHFLDVSALTGKPLASGGSDPATEVGAYSRLNLFDAAGGYATFARDVTVDQDPATITDPNLQSFAEFARADAWSNDIGGAGGLTKRGTGTLTLSGADTYVGSTIVAGGTLDVTGSIRAATKVEAGGTLAGAGRVGDVSVAGGGTVAPGATDGKGTLEIGGSLRLAAGASYVVRTGSAGATSLRIADKAKLDGAHLLVRLRDPLRPGARITILTARGGVSGAFADASTDAPGLVPRLTYAADAVYLTLHAKSGTGVRPN